MHYLKRAYRFASGENNIQNTENKQSPNFIPKNYTSEYKVPVLSDEINRLAEISRESGFKNALFLLGKITDEYYKVSIDDIFNLQRPDESLFNLKRPNNRLKYYNFKSFPVLLNSILIDQLLPTIETQFNFNKNSRRSPTIPELTFMRENVYIQEIFFKSHEIILDKFGIHYNKDLSNYYIDMLPFEYIFSDLANNLNICTKILISLFNFNYPYIVPIFVNLLHHQIIAPYTHNPTIERFKWIWIQIINTKNKDWQKIYTESNIIFYPSTDLYDQYTKIESPTIGKYIEFKK